MTVNAMAPGYLQQFGSEKQLFPDDQGKQEDYYDRVVSRTMVGRPSTPEDLVGATIFLASPAASYVTGHCLTVDGGFTALGMR
jgi:NAD(P)-dependent dehydrogenase (short-subunit alcohol dehydrogenase family)